MRWFPGARHFLWAPDAPEERLPPTRATVDVFEQLDRSKTSTLDVLEQLDRSKTSTLDVLEQLTVPGSSTFDEARRAPSSKPSRLFATWARSSKKSATAFDARGVQLLVGEEGRRSFARGSTKSKKAVDARGVGCSGEHPVEVVPHASGEVYAYVQGDIDRPSDVEMTVEVPVDGKHRKHRKDHNHRGHHHGAYVYYE